MKNNLINFTLLVLILFTTKVSNAQQLKGNIIDSETNQPVKNAHIYFADLEIGYLANDLGEFELKEFPQFNSRLLITALGYEEKVVFLENDTLITIYLEPQHAILEEVIVSTPTGKLQSENITNITSIKLNNSNSIQTNTIGEALAGAPGVYVSSVGRGISKPVIRGVSGGRIVTYVDGLRIENQQWGSDHGIGVTSLGIDRLEIIKGPSSLLYGSDAIGGVLYFVESQYVPEDSWNSFVETNFESNSLSNVTNLGTQLAKNNSKFNLFVGSSVNADYMLANGSRLHNSRFSSQAVKMSYGFNKRNWMLNIRYNFSNSRIGIPGDVESDSLYPELFYTKNVEWKSTLPFQKINNNFLNIENKFYFDKGYLLIQLGNTTNNLKEFEEAISEPGIDMVLNSSTLNIRYAHKFSDKLELITGIQSMYQINSNSPKAEETLIPNATSTDFGLFSILYVGKDKFKAQLGVRGDYRNIKVKSPSIEKDFNGFNYSVGGGYFGDNSIVRINLSTGFRAPHTSEMIANGAHDGSFQYIIGDVNLKTENATQVDLTYEYNSEHLSLIVNPYFNQIQNFIYLQRQNTFIDGYPVFQYEQTSKVDMYGVDFGIHYHPHALHRLHIETNFSYIRAIDGNNQFIDQIPPAKWVTKLKYEFDRKGKFYLKNVILRNDLILAQNEIAPTEVPSNMYNVLNFGVNAVCLTKNHKIGLNAGVKNILNSNYIDHLSSLKELSIGGPGINFYLGVKFNFDHQMKH